VSVACHNNCRTCALFLVPPDHVTCSHSSSSLARDQRHQKTFAECPAPEVAPAPAWTWWSVPRFPARHYTKVFSCDLPEGEPLGGWCLSPNHPGNLSQMGSFESSEMEIAAYGRSCAEPIFGSPGCHLFNTSHLGECCFTGLRRKDRNWTRHRIASVARTPSRMTEITPFHRRNLPGVEKNSSLLGAWVRTNSRTRGSMHPPQAVVTARLSLWRVKPSLDKPDPLSSRACSGGGFL
jgi:hypothetical protein